MSKRQSAAASRYDPSAPRVSKREQLRQQRRRRSFVWNLIVLGTAVAFLAVIAWYVFANQRPGQLPGETAIPVEGGAVVPAGTQIDYGHYPPSSGNHYADAAPWGVQTEAVPEGTFVTNLAHGGVVFLYQCPDGCPELVAQFEALYKKAPPEKRFNSVQILVSPYARPMDAPIVALAWGHQLNLQQFNEDLLLRWYKRFVNQGPDPQP